MIFQIIKYKNTFQEFHDESGDTTGTAINSIMNVVCKLESVVAIPGAYNAVSKDGVIVSKGEPRCRIEALKQGAAPTFTKPYRFLKENTLPLQLNRK